MDHEATYEEVLAKSMKERESREEWEEQQSIREFSSTLIRARLAAGISQAELARRIGVRQPMIARLEAGMQTPKIDTLVRLAKALGVDFTITAGDTIKAAPHKAEAA